MLRRAVLAALLAVAAVPLAAADPVAIPVTLAPGPDGPQAGRLIVFAQRVAPGAPAQPEVDSSPFAPTDTAVAARDVEALRPGTAALVDGETDAFPTPFSALPAGTYRFQAVLDRNHDYNYGGRGPGDIVSPVVEARLPGAIPTLVLANVVPDPAAPAPAPGLRPLDFVSPRLTAFWGRPIHLRGWVALPPGYEQGQAHYPTVYETHGFGGTLASQRLGAAEALRRMQAGETPPMIWVFLDESSATGTHEFADSANNGPWGEALTAELIPALEHQYRMDARPSGRFLTGHSSGGWATLWLQTHYPASFGGTWSTSPDPSDFHDFTNIDLYAPGANAYRRADGTATPLVRDHGRLIATMEQFARLEQVLGPVGGQFASFDWVFSPKGPDGRPLPMFDRATGAVHPDVVAYWRDHYDIAFGLQRDWARVGRLLDGKIHIFVGTADTFYLDGPAHRLEAVLDRLGAHAHVTFIPDRTHFDLYRIGDDRAGLGRQIAWEMYAVARPGSHPPAAQLPAAPAHP